MRVAIHKNDEVFTHSGLWTAEWESHCLSNAIEYDVFDFFELGALNRIADYDCALWHFGNYSLQEMLFARSILSSMEGLGVRVFPDYATSWHFDDKVAQSFLLQSIDAPIPDWKLFVTERSCLQWLESEAKFPIVAKLRNGSGSTNVRLLSSQSEARRYAQVMFRDGFSPAPNVGFKAASNMRSARNASIVLKRVKRVPEFFRTRAKARAFPREHGYVYVQSFVENSGFDLKVVVIGDKLSFIGRRVRKGEFRASGGGDLTFDHDLISQEVIDAAFRASDALDFQCMGYDFVIDSSTLAPKIVEISYGFSHSALLEAGGYFDRLGKWHSDPLNAPQMVMEQLLREE